MSNFIRRFWSSISNIPYGNESLLQKPAGKVETQDLNLDCLVYIFENNMSIMEMMKLRTVCRSWNTAVCEVLRKKNTLKVFPGRELLANLDRAIVYEDQKSHPVLRISERPEHEDMVLLGVCNDQHVASLVSFLCNRMPNITKFALVLEVNDLFDWSWFESILDAVPNMETFFLSPVHVDRPKKRRRGYEEVRIHIIRSEHHEALEVMHRSFQKRTNRLRKLFLSKEHCLFRWNDTPDYIEDLLEGLELLIIDSLPMNIKQKPLMRELSLYEWSKPYQHIFPNLETLRVTSRWVDPESVIDDIDAELMPNLKHLEFGGTLTMYSGGIISSLNSLPNLEQLSCETVAVSTEFVRTTKQRFLAEHFNSSLIRLNLTQQSDVSGLLQKKLPTILRAFVGLKQLTIHHCNTLEENFVVEEHLQSVPRRITVELIGKKGNVKLERYRYMGRFREVLEEKFVKNCKKYDKIGDTCGHDLDRISITYFNNR